MYRWQRNKFFKQQTKYEKQQKQQQYLHSLEIDNASKALISLKNEKLQNEINFKNSELATSAMHLVQKGELLNRVKNELTQLIKVLDNTNGITDLKKTIKVLIEDEKTDKDWENFMHHFDKVHSDFVIKIKERHIALSGNDLKLCAYLRMNLSTKEIAQLMNISIRGVEISRYRLRKKLGIEAQSSLFQYLINIDKAK